MAQDHEKYMRVALEEGERGGAEGNTAVGSVVVRGDTVIALGRNLVSSTHDATAHAETVAIRNAGAAQGNPDLTGCTLYTTFEPCPMCCGAIMVSGIAKLVMGARHDPSVSKYGVYTVEKLVDMGKWGDRLHVVPELVLAQECVDIRRKWEGGS
jgi:tRNA(adenine34) deaminase